MARDRDDNFVDGRSLDLAEIPAEVVEVTRAIACMAIDQAVINGEAGAFFKSRLAGIATMGTWVPDAIMDAFWRMVIEDPRFDGFDHTDKMLFIKPELSPDSKVRPYPYAVLSGKALNSTEDERFAAWAQAYGYARLLTRYLSAGQEFDLGYASGTLQSIGVEMSSIDRRLLLEYLRAEPLFINQRGRHSFMVRPEVSMQEVRARFDMARQVGGLKDKVDSVLARTFRPGGMVSRTDVVRAVNGELRGANLSPIQNIEVSSYMRQSSLLTVADGTGAYRFVDSLERASAAGVDTPPIALDDSLGRKLGDVGIGTRAQPVSRPGSGRTRRRR